jgi:uncharacterized protein YndB with AHSA1/START domain
VPTARARRTIAAPQDELWRVVSDPHHLPRWWPRVARVENVADGAFTEVMKTSRGKTVRADFDVTAADALAGELRWSQRLEGTPFAAVLSASHTELRLRPSEGVAMTTEVTIEVRQKLNGFFAHFGSFMVRRATAATLKEALDELERISG